MDNPLSDGVRVCDGGLGSTLALHGHPVDTDPLWSARLLHTQPEAILKVHDEFVKAGADILISSSYQASVEGYREHLNLSASDAHDLMTRSVVLARTAAQKVKRPVLVAGSVGPYGACQGDGSEYTGGHLAGLTEQQLMDWHRPRVAALVLAGVDLLAVETMPAGKEALAVIRLLREFPGVRAWVTFSCKDANLTNAGDQFANAVLNCYAAAGGVAGGPLAGVGLNCTAPHLVTPLLGSLSECTTLPPPGVLPRVVYPNSGEEWISGTGWVPSSSSSSSGWAGVQQWVEQGAAVVGGCCRVGPQQIAAIASTISEAGTRQATSAS